MMGIRRLSPLVLMGVFCLVMLGMMIQPAAARTIDEPIIEETLPGNEPQAAPVAVNDSYTTDEDTPLNAPAFLHRSLNVSAWDPPDRATAGNMFRVDVRTNLIVTGFDIFLGGSGPQAVEIWYKSGTYVGFEQNPAAWTLLVSTMVESQGAGNLTYVPVDDLYVSALTDYAFYIQSTTTSLTCLNYGVGIVIGNEIWYGGGTANNVNWGNFYPSKSWAGRLHYDKPNGVLANDSDADGDALTAVLESGPANGEFRFFSDGGFVYTPTLNFYGLDTFTYSASDGALTDTAVVSITVNQVDFPPVAEDDVYTTDEDTPLSETGIYTRSIETIFGGPFNFAGHMFDIQALRPITITGFDVRIDDAGIQMVEVWYKSGTYEGFEQDPAAWTLLGSAQVESQGEHHLTYVPIGGLAIPAGQAYGLYIQSTTSSLLSEYNAPKVYYNDYVRLTLGTMNSVNWGSFFPGYVWNGIIYYDIAAGVVANDADANGNVLTATLTSSPANGALNLYPDGRFVYTPTLNFYGEDSFSYMVTDGRLTDTAMATIMVNSVIDLPVAVDDTYATNQDTPLSVPAFQHRGLRVLLGSNRATAGNMFRVMVNHDLLITGFDVNMGTPGQQAVEIWYKSGTYVGFEHDPAAWTLLTSTMVEAQWVGIPTYVPVEDLRLSQGEEYSFYIQSTTTNLYCFNFMHTVTTSEMIFEGGTANDLNWGNAYPNNTWNGGIHYDKLAGVLGNDTNPTGDALTAILDSGPANGELSLLPDGGFVYTPTLDFFGVDTFTYIATDGVLTDTAEVTITVSQASPALVAQDDAYMMDEGTVLSDTGTDQRNISTEFSGEWFASGGMFDVTARHPITITGFDVNIVMSPTETVEVWYKSGAYEGFEQEPQAWTLLGTAQVDSQGYGLPTYVPIGGLYIPAGQTYGLYIQTETPWQIYDPAAFPGSYSNGDVELRMGIALDLNWGAQHGWSNWNGAVYYDTIGGVIANDINLNGSVLTATLTGNPTNGALSLFPDGGFVYTPTLDFYGVDHFSYMVSDGILTDTAVATITVNELDYPPVAANDTYITDEDTLLNVPAFLHRSLSVSFWDANRATAGNMFRAEVRTNLIITGFDVFIEGSGQQAVEIWYKSGTYEGFEQDPAAWTLLVSTTVESQGAGNLTYVPVDDLRVSALTTYSFYVQSTTTSLTCLDYAFGVAIGNDIWYNGGTANDVNWGSFYPNNSWVGRIYYDKPNGVLANDSDPDGDALTAVLDSGPANGEVSLFPDGGFVYTPTLNFYGVDTFTYMASDGVLTDTALVTIDVAQVDFPPVAQDDAYITDEDVPLEATGIYTRSIQTDHYSMWNFAGNMFDIIAKRPLTITGFDVYMWMTGTQTVEVWYKSGTYEGFEQDPAAWTLLGSAQVDSQGYDIPTYVPIGGLSIPAGATFGLYIQSTTTSLSSDDIARDTYHNDDLILSLGTGNYPNWGGFWAGFIWDGAIYYEIAAGVLVNDTDRNLDVLTATLTSAPLNGTLNLYPDGRFIYTPTLNFHGVDSFVYQVSDGRLTDTAVVMLTVNSVIDPPVGVDDAYMIDEDMWLHVQPTEHRSIQTDFNGSTIAAGNMFNITVLNDLTITGFDVCLVSSGAQTVEVWYKSGTYEGFERTPAAWTLLGTQVVLSAGYPTLTHVTIGGLSIPAGQSYSLYIQSLTSPVVSSNGSATYANDDLSLSLGTRNLANWGPFYHGYTWNGRIYYDVFAGLLENDINPEGVPLSALLAGGPANGELVFYAGGGFVYTPTLNFNGVDSFTYVVTDGALTDTAVVSITVLPINDLPVVDAGDSLAVTEGSPISFFGSFTDPGRLLAGELVCWRFGDGEMITGTLTPIHTYGDGGVFTVTLTVTDVLGGASSDWLTVTVENVAPLLTPISDTEITLGAPLTIPVTFSDPGWLDAHILALSWGDGLTETIMLSPGVLSIELSHVYRAAGEFMVAIGVRDDDGDRSFQTFTVNVIPKTYQIAIPMLLRR